MTRGPEPPFHGREYPPPENTRPPEDAYRAVDYPAGPELPPPVYPALPHPGAAGYPGVAGYPTAPGYPSHASGYPYLRSPYDPYRQAKPPGTNGKAIAALVTALVGLPFCLLPSIAGLILGIIAMSETRRTGQDGYGIALAGTIIGGLAAAFLVVLLLMWVAMVAMMAGSGFESAP